LALALLGTGLAYVLYFRLIARVGPAKAITVTYLVPAFAMLWAGLFLGEALTPAMLAACAVILLGTRLATGLLKLPFPERRAAEAGKQGPRKRNGDSPKAVAVSTPGDVAVADRRVNYFFGAVEASAGVPPVVVPGIAPALLASAVVFLRSSRVVVDVAAFSFGDMLPAASAGVPPVEVPGIAPALLAAAVSFFTSARGTSDFAEIGGAASALGPVPLPGIWPALLASAVAFFTSARDGDEAAWAITACAPNSASTATDSEVSVFFMSSSPTV
jgi:hypothetical protein